MILPDDVKRERINQCLKLMRQNDNDTINLPRVYKTGAVRMAAGVELRKEKEQLMEQMEILTGSPQLAQAMVDAIIPPPAVKPKEDGGDEGGDDGKGKEKCKV